MILDALSRRAPTIVIATLCATLAGFWMEAPMWLPSGIAIVVGCLAVVLLGARNRRDQPAAIDQDDDARAHWIASELAGKGSPAGSYLLGFFALVTIMLTGVSGAYALPGWAGLALAAAWGIANACYPTGE